MQPEHLTTLLVAALVITLIAAVREILRDELPREFEDAKRRVKNLLDSPPKRHL